MKKSKKFKTFLYLILLFFFVLCFQTIAYSALNSTLNITGDAYARVDADVRITGFNVYAASTNSISKYEEYGKDIVSASLSLPYNDSNIIYKIDITNYGAPVALYAIEGLPSNLDYELTDYSLNDKLCDSSNNCSYGIVSTFYIKIKYNSYDSNILNHNINLTFKFKNIYSISYSGINGNFPVEALDKSTLNIVIDNPPKYINVYENSIEKDRNTYVYDNTTGNLIIDNINGNLVIEKGESYMIPGKEFSKQLKDFVNGTTDATYKSEDSLIKYIGFYENEMPDGYSQEELFNLPHLIVSDDNRVKAYNDNGNIYVYSINDIKPNANMYSMFREMKNLTEIDLSNLETDHVTNMQSLFHGLINMTSFDIEHFDTSNVTIFEYMFYGCNKLTSLDLSNFNTSKATAMGSMFQFCSSLTSIKLSSFDTSNVKYMYAMFAQNISLKSIDLSNFDTSSVVDISNMFYADKLLEKIYVGDGWNVSNVTTMNNMFYYCSKLPNYDANYIDASKAYVGDGGYLSYPPKDVSIDGVVYKYEEGMTWGEWVDSIYNTRGFVNNNDLIYTDDLTYALVYEVDNGTYTSYGWPYATDLIDPNLVYVTFNESSEDGEW